MTEFTIMELRGLLTAGARSLLARLPVIDLALNQFDALVADAERYRAFRAIITEPDEAKQTRIIEQCSQFMDAIAVDEQPTPEQIDAIADDFLRIACGARNG